MWDFFKRSLCPMRANCKGSTFGKLVWSRTRFRQRKSSTTINSLELEIAGWVGGFPPEGVGVEVLLASLKSLFPPVRTKGKRTLSAARSGNFDGMSRTARSVQKVCATEVCPHFSALTDRNILQTPPNRSARHPLQSLFCAASHHRYSPVPHPQSQSTRFKSLRLQELNAQADLNI